ncbi:helix-turn-helix domain-containing protein [candidate division KSB1 bacterium]|nr:helix-turn-helix domain-containing protein [candidate division KSB1 bacterium]
MQHASQITTMHLSHFSCRDTDFHVSELRDLSTTENPFLHRPHQNDFYQLILYTRGQGKHQIDFNTFNYHPSTLFAIARGQVQVMDCLAGTDACILSFAEQFLYRCENEMQWLHQLHLFDLQRENRAIVLDETDFQQLIMLVDHMKSEFQAKQSLMKLDILRDLLRVFINHSERLVQNDDRPVRDNDYDLYCCFRKILDANYQSCRSVKEYADMLCITPKKLNQLTLKFTDKHAKKIIEERLFMEIKRVLLYTNINVTQIALENGFNDPTNFVKFFKRFAQTTPSKYRFTLQNGAF